MTDSTNITKAINKAITKSINKEKIAIFLKSRFGLSNLLCQDITNCFFNELIALTIANNSISLKKFGRLSVSSKKARRMIDIETKQHKIIPARKILCFTPSQSLKRMVNHESQLLGK